MVKSNEIALQLKNNVSEEISVSLFSTINSTNFLKSQIQSEVEAQYYNFGITVEEIGSPITIEQENKIKNETIELVIPYYGPNNDGQFVPDDFVSFLKKWFLQNNLGYIYVYASNEIAIYSDVYNYGKIDYIAGP